MRILKKVAACLLVVVMTVSAAGCGSEKKETGKGITGTIKIATKPMTEQYILGEMLKQLIENKTDYKVEVTKGIGGGTSNIHPAMEKGEFDLYPEYTSSGWVMVLGNQAGEVSDDEILEKLQKEYQQLKFRMVGMELKKIETIAAQTAGCGDQLLFEEDMSPDSVRKLASDVMESCGGRCAVFNGNDENGYRYIIGEKDGDLREFVKEMNRKLQGRGGGKPFFVQGSVQASRKEIETFFAS